MTNQRRSLLKRHLSVFLIAIIITAGLPITLHTGYAYDPSSFNFSLFPVPQHLDTQVKLQWTSVVNAVAYRLYRDNSEIYNINVNSDREYLSYLDTRLTPETEYTYKIEAYSDATLQELIRTATGTITTYQMTRPSIQSYQYDINNDTIHLSWKNNSSAATISEIKRISPTSVLASVYGLDTTCSFNISPLLDDSPYQFIQLAVVSADNKGHRSGDSEPVAVFTLPPPFINASSENGVAKISWGGYLHMEHFNLERSKYGASTWSEWELVNTELSSKVNHVTDTLPDTGLYRYRLHAKESSGYIGVSNISEPVTTPIAPTQLSCQITAPGRIDLSWTNPANNPFPLKVERKTDTGSYRTLSTLDKSATTYSDTSNIQENHQYTYRIVAYNSDKNKSVSSESSIITIKPKAPTDLGLAIASNTQINLCWNDTSDNELGFKVERKDGTGRFVQIATVPANVSTYKDMDLTPGTTYSYRVRSYNPLGDSSEYSNEASSSTGLRFDGPVSLTLTAVSSSQIDLTWTYAGNLNQQTVIERKEGVHGRWETISSLSNTTLKYSDTGLSPDTQYFYRVKAAPSPHIYSLSYPNDDTGKGVYSKLSKPTELIGNASSTKQINLHWNDHSNEAGFVIERRTDNKNYVLMTTTLANTSSWSDTSVVSNTRYTYRVKAISETNTSEYSNELTITCSVLTPPSDLEANAVSGSAIELTWTDNTINESGFEIWRKETSSENWEKIDTVYANSKSYTDTGLPSNKKFLYKIRSYILRDEIYSTFTKEAEAQTTLLAPPTKLQFTVSSDTQVTLTWKDNAKNETGFKIERKMGDDGSWVELVALEANKTRYESTDLVPYTQYFYRVKVFSDTYNSSAISEVIAVSTGLPSAPSALTLDAFSANEIRLSWNHSANFADGFSIERKKAGDSRYKKITEVDTGHTTYSDKGLESNTQYWYRIRSFNESGFSAYSNEASTTTKPLTTFTDVPETHWAKDAIFDLTNRGIIQGKAEGLFCPGDIITRAEFITLMVKSFKLNRTPVGTFMDVKPGNWFYKEVMTAKISGIISGSNNNYFYPNQALTRQDLAVITARTLKIIGKPLPAHDPSILNKYSDAALASPYALSSLASLNGEKIINGKSETVLDPKGYATRAEAVMILSKVIDR